jgi:hypothetical protein
MRNLEGPSKDGTQWYIEWFGSFTLERLAEVVNVEENCLYRKRCADGKQHNLCLVPYDVVTSFRSSRKNAMN